MVALGVLAKTFGRQLTFRLQQLLPMVSKSSVEVASWQGANIVFEFCGHFGSFSRFALHFARVAIGQVIGVVTTFLVPNGLHQHFCISHCIHSFFANPLQPNKQTFPLAAPAELGRRHAPRCMAKVECPTTQLGTLLGMSLRPLHYALIWRPTAWVFLGYLLGFCGTHSNRVFELLVGGFICMVIPCSFPFTSCIFRKVLKMLQAASLSPRGSLRHFMQNNLPGLSRMSIILIICQQNQRHIESGAQFS